MTPSPTIATTRPSARMLADEPGLVLGEEIGVVMLEAERLGDDAARLRMVARQHDDVAHLPGAQREDRGRRLGPQLVFQDEHAGEHAVDGDERRRSAGRMRGGLVSRSPPRATRRATP